jgi:hypothetical protein
MLDTPMLQSAYHIKSAELVIYAFILITLMRKTKFEYLKSSYNFSHKSFVVLTCGSFKVMKTILQPSFGA